MFSFWKTKTTVEEKKTELTEANVNNIDKVESFIENLKIKKLMLELNVSLRPYQR